jgi:hypothetical protein
MASSHRGSYFGVASYQGKIYTEIAAPPLLAALPFDTSLPEPLWDMSFAPGKRAPRDGIYEMVSFDGHIVGGLQLFIKGEASQPEDFVEFGPDAGDEDCRDFLWRLLWEDTRYQGGRIPEEEALYPMPDGAVEAPAPAPRRLRSEGGQPCPQEGWWFTPAKLDSRRHFHQGEVMPVFTTDYGATLWQWDERQDA